MIISRLTFAIKVSFFLLQAKATQHTQHETLLTHMKFIFKPILSRFIGQAQMTRQGQLFSKILYQKVNHLSLSCSNTELTGNLLISLMKGAVYE